MRKFSGPRPHRGHYARAGADASSVSLKRRRQPSCSGGTARDCAIASSSGLLVKVNGEIFTQTDLEQRQIERAPRRRTRVTSLDMQNDARSRRRCSRSPRTSSSRSIDELLLIQHGRELGYELSDDQFKKVLDQIKTENKLNDAGLKTALAGEGLTLDTYRQKIERQMIVGVVQRQEIMQKATLTDEEARQYYDSHQNEFMKPATVTLREILIAVPTEERDGQDVFNVASDDAAKKKMADARARLAKGESFANVAAEVSDSPSKASGGLIGVVNVEEMNPELRDRIDELKAGDVTEPLRTKGGYQILEVDARSPAKPRRSTRCATRSRRRSTRSGSTARRRSTSRSCAARR